VILAAESRKLSLPQEVGQLGLDVDVAGLAAAGTAW